MYNFSELFKRVSREKPKLGSFIWSLEEEADADESLMAFDSLSERNRRCSDSETNDLTKRMTIFFQRLLNVSCLSSPSSPPSTSVIPVLCEERSSDDYDRNRHENKQEKGSSTKMDNEKKRPKTSRSPRESHGPA
jgi:hypothetical protein